MDNKIEIQGMHCDACKMLIKMELEENGFEDKVQEITLTGDHEGYVVLDNSEEKDIAKAKEIINSMDNYQVK